MCECGGKCGSNCTCDDNLQGEGTYSCHDKVERKLLFCVVGKSASGKDILCKTLAERLGWKMVCSYTDRPMRAVETDGVEHYFVSKEEMDKLLSQDNILAETKIGDVRYCATTDCLDSETKLYIVDPAGVYHLSERANKLGIDLCVIYVEADDDIRYKRARGRKDSYDTVIKRFDAEAKDFNDFRASLSKDFEWDLFSSNGKFDWAVFSNNDSFELFYLKAGGAMVDYYNRWKEGESL